MRKFTLTTLLILISFSMASAYTGLIIDTTTSPMPQEAVICPSNKCDLLGNGTLSNDVNIVIEKGLICYTKSIDDARSCGFVGDDPLIVRANSRFDDAVVTNILIPTEGAEKIIKISTDPAYLGNLKIAIVL